HNNAMAALVQHPNSLLRIILERALQNQETSKYQVALNLLSLQSVQFVLAPLPIIREIFISKSEHTRSTASEPFESFLVIGGHFNQHIPNSFWGTLNANEGNLILLSLMVE